MIRAVLDTNVYVAALLSADSAPARVVRALGDGIFDAIVCPRLLAELEAVLARPKLARLLDAEIPAPYLGWFARVAIEHPDPEPIPPVSTDPDDDYVIALARESHAHVIVSGDAHLLTIHGLEPRALTPSAFATLLDSLR